MCDNCEKLTIPELPEIADADINENLVVVVDDGTTTYKRKLGELLNVMKSKGNYKMLFDENYTVEDGIEVVSIGGYESRKVILPDDTYVGRKISVVRRNGSSGANTVETTNLTIVLKDQTEYSGVILGGIVGLDPNSVEISATFVLIEDNAGVKKWYVL